MKKLFLTLTVILLSIPFYPVKAMEKTSDILKKNVVTTGDGLYVDSTIDGRYIYRGANPNNYIKLGDDLYRIISLEKDGTIKVIKQESIGDKAWDEGDTKESTNSEDFCSKDSYGIYAGCKSWGSNTTTLDANVNKVTQMPWFINGTLKNLPDKEATLNTYLNNDFYNNLSDDVKDFIVEGTWNVGPTVAYNQTNLSESIKEESAYKWKGKVSLMNATDYVKSSANRECTSLNAYFQNSSCYNNSNTHNYLYSNNRPWTVSPSAGGIGASSVLYVDSDGGLNYGFGRGENHAAIYSGGVRPAFYLSSETTLNGEGTETNPYTVSKYVEEPKEENKDKNEVKVDNAEVVEVPSTSAFGSIVIVILGIICIISSLIINKYMTKKAK